jgi:O-antigen biosynthesis protein
MTANRPSEPRGHDLVSVIVPAYRAWSTLPRVLAALRAEIEDRNREVLLVESSGDISADDLQARWPWARVITLPARALPGKARNIGLAAASGERIAFLDADAIPEPGWLDALEEGLSLEVDGVAGSVLNGTPYSPTGTAGYLLAFSDWLPGRDTRALHAATCNLMLRRGVLERAGGFREDLLSGEDTILTLPLGRAGRLAFAPEARVRHLNRTSWRAYLSHQRSLGVSFAAVRASVDFPHSGFARPAFVPLTPAFRLASVFRRLARHPRQAALGALLLPVLAAGAIAWAAGLASGYRGAGLSKDDIPRAE